MYIFFKAFVYNTDFTYSGKVESVTNNKESYLLSVSYNHVSVLILLSLKNIHFLHVSSSYIIVE